MTNSKIYLPMRKLLLLLFTFLCSLAVAQERNAVDLFFKNAEKFRAAKDYDRAILEYSQAISIADSTAKVRYWKGVCYLLTKDSANAIKDWNRALELDNNYIPAYLGLSSIYENQKDFDNYKKVKSMWLEHEKDPIKKIKLCLETTKFFFDKEMYDDARIYTKAGIELSPNDIDILFLDAKIANKIGKNQEAILTIDKILGMYPSYAKPQQLAKYKYEKGLAFYLLEDYDRAMPILEEANMGPYQSLVAKLKPDYYFSVAKAYEDIYEFERSKDLLHIAMKVDKTYIKANILLADIIVKQENHHKGIHYFELGLKDYQGNDKIYLHAYNEFIDILICSKKYEEALEYSNKALANFKRTRSLLFFKTVALFKLNKREEAINTGLELLSDTNITPQEFVKASLLMGHIYGMQDPLKCKQSLQAARKGPYYHVASYSLDHYTMMSLNKQAL
ncbi:tetratricopeptide repeat protein [Flammeovirga sp. MY04]|uniref:tetratricopeptide repeat protein n=1 Tax=Flammeovirga sp. MY04 TaxID=1191459 RepID=UPI0008063FB8|nr:tetratricopeptide repeat protein [Flammeovirga sp. MY04]ANQ47861.1 tetratricopeptide repeat protein [Flammeovirga sp. MY04]